jgi:hypothetical protein
MQVCRGIEGKVPHILILSTTLSGNFHAPAALLLEYEPCIHGKETWAAPELQYGRGDEKKNTIR